MLWVDKDKICRTLEPKVQNLIKLQIWPNKSLSYVWETLREGKGKENADKFKSFPSFLYHKNFTISKYSIQIFILPIYQTEP